MEITIYGASDDLVETDVGGDKDEHQNYGHGIWMADLFAPSGSGLTVHVFYDDAWHAGVGQLANPVDPDGDGMPLPSWPARFHVPDGTPDAAALTLDAPDGTVLTNIRRWR